MDDHGLGRRKAVDRMVWRKIGATSALGSPDDYRTQWTDDDDNE